MELHQVTQMYTELQAKFDMRVKEAFKEAAGVVEDRAVLYDYQRPVWERVHFPGGFLQEISKKVARLKQETAQEGFMPVMWPACRGELLDIINYAAFMVSYGDMLEKDVTIDADTRIRELVEALTGEDLSEAQEKMKAARATWHDSEDPPIQEQATFPGLDAAVNTGYIDADTNVPMGPLPEVPSEPEPEPELDPEPEPEPEPKRRRLSLRPRRHK